MLKTAVVGVRGVGGGHFRALASHPRSELVAVADLDTVAARRLVDEQDHGSAPTVFASLDEMLDGLPGLEAVIIATPHHLHAPMSLGMSLLNTN